VRKVTADAGITAGVADCELVSQAVDVAIARAEPTVAKAAQGTFDATGEFA
jgi:hypothetical protein